LKLVPEQLSVVRGVQPPDSQSWDAILARWVSHVFSPPTLTLLGIILITAAIGTANAWFWSTVYIFIAVLLPVIYVVREVRRSAVTDFHIKLREQRIRPMLVMLALSLLGWLILLAGNAPYALVLFAGIGVIQVAFLLTVTIWWKISGHSMAASGFAVLVFVALGLHTAPVLLLIPLVAWARIRRKRHTLTQTMLGSLAGIAYILAFFLLLELHYPGGML
jgi:membrane-associated phospholipid phosphatase